MTRLDNRIPMRAACPTGYRNNEAGGQHIHRPTLPPEPHVHRTSRRYPLQGPDSIAAIRYLACHARHRHHVARSLCATRGSLPSTLSTMAATSFTFPTRTRRTTKPAGPSLAYRIWPPAHYLYAARHIMGLRFVRSAAGRAYSTRSQSNVPL